MEHTNQKDEAIARLEKAVALPNAAPALREKLDALRGTGKKNQPPTPP
jgi:hypothetical protein